MKLKPLFWKLFPSYCFPVVISLLIITGYVTSIVEKFYFEQTAKNSSEKIYLLESVFNDAIKSNNYQKIDSLSKTYGIASNIRLTVMLPDGRVIGDTEKKPDLMDNHINRPEIRVALREEYGKSSRYSYTLEKNMQYYAKLLKSNDTVTGIVRASISTESIKGNLSDVKNRILFTGFIVVIITALISLGISRYISNRIRHLQTGALNFSKGNFDYKLSGCGALELDLLAQSMNSMATQLNEKIRTITRQHNEKKSILESMTEGVLAIDTDRKIMDLNKGASDIIGLKIHEAKGMLVEESIRNSDIQKMVDRIMLSDTAVEEEVLIFQDKGQECFLQVKGTRLNDSDNNSTGILLVMNDITRIKKLEMMRRDFVANVSHELRTPLTSIIGFAETILTGAIDSSQDTMRFLNIIKKHAVRLDNIIEDLLELSRIEKMAEHKEIEILTDYIKPVLLRASEICSPKASEKNITVSISCENDIHAHINPSMLEQALINLIDNAIKYSDNDKTFSVEVKKETDFVEIKVSDQGFGIDNKHLPRIFERFYRVDKSRSRKPGGTGLGLSIVKYIVLAHKGSITVNSKPGAGSSFVIRLPA